MRSFGTWLETDDDSPSGSPDRPHSGYGPLAARVLAPSVDFNGLGVVMVPPVGYDHSSSFRALQVLARALTERGCLVVRVEPFGTGDSAGTASDVTGLHVWQNVVAEGAAYVRRSGARDVLLLGCRFGATLALLAVESTQPIAVVALDPVLSGRRYVRGLQVMSQDHDQPDVGLLVGGTEFPKSLLADISELDLARRPPAAVPSLLVARPGSSAEARFAERLADHGAEAEVWSSSALEGFLGVHAEQAVIDASFTEDVTEWICSRARVWAEADGSGPEFGSSLVRPSDPERQAASLSWGGGRVTETFVEVGADGLSGVLTTPADVTGPSGDLVVFLNSGAEPHTGPGRAWVEFARDHAIHQVSAIRIDMRGWGDSPDPPRGRYVPGHPYDIHSIDDTRDLVESFGQAGWDKVVLSGLCAGAWLALHVARDTKFGGVLAINPSLQYELGDPILATADDYRKALHAEIAEIKREAKAGRWDREDRAGMRPPAGEWLDALVENAVPISLIYCGDDVALEYLTDRLALRLAAAQESGRVKLHWIPDVDHSMHRTWLRWKVLELLVAELNSWN
jgi:pimeloyl-ACP methyl ester carboxylesterase